jgi:hypothetical protein
MSFLRHEEIYQADELRVGRARSQDHALAHRLDEFPVGYSLAGCSPAEPASASPTNAYFETIGRRLAIAIRRKTQTGLNPWSHCWGAPHSR